jgi:hypothetical protein
MSLIPTTCCRLPGPTQFFLLICVYCGISVETRRKLLFTGIISLTSRQTLPIPFTSEQFLLVQLRGFCRIKEVKHQNVVASSTFCSFLLYLSDIKSVKSFNVIITHASRGSHRHCIRASISK